MKRIFTIFVFISLIFASFSVYSRVQAASLYVSPAGGSFGVGSTFTVTVRTNTEGQAINTVEANISFSIDTLELVRVSASPVFNLQAPGSPAKGSGTAYFGGGLPTPGYTGSNGVVGSMTFRAKAEGVATVNITTGKALLNDGSGTNALASTAGARFTIVPPAVGTPEISSTTHPDPEKWENKGTVELSWSRPEGAYGFSFELDQEPDTIPDNILDTTITTTEKYENLEDGVWYFHIKARRQPSGSGFGNTRHYQILVDTTPPKPFDIKLVGQSDLNDVTRTPSIEFTATDATAGIDHYDIYLDDKYVKTVQADSYTFSKLDPGPHIIKVTVYDRAGNTTSASLPIIVSGPAPAAISSLFSQQLQVSVMTLIGFGLLIWFMILLILLLLLRRPKRRDAASEVEALQQEIDSSLEKLKLDINRKILKLMRRWSADTYNDEALLAQEISRGVGRTRKKIDNKINKLGKVTHVKITRL